MKRLILLSLTVLLAGTACGESRSQKIKMPKGGSIEVFVALPPNFDPETTYNVLVGPGEWYWQDEPSQPGWITVSGDPFYVDERLEQAPVVLDWIRKTYNVRGDKFHIACWSRNSSGAFQIVQNYPDDFHSVTGVAGMPGQVSESELKGLKKVRVQFIVGENDQYWKSGSERWHKKFTDAGITSTIEIIPNGGHVMAEIKNKPFFKRMNALVEELGR